ncbi:amino acid adenylation domain-containing protein, partial [Pectobacterium brasiliense]|uniref:non-ribosomal peptide synthetase n=1 Tax=Pectobacterium brasiliense TaxID=180957 RepID=UPI003812F62D
MSSIQNNSLKNPSVLNSDHSSDSNKLPLSSTQQVVWLDQTLNPDSPNYNIGTWLRIDEHLDETLFSQAFEMLVSRHDALHLQLIHTHGLPLQALTDASSTSINVYDFSHYDDAEERAQQHIHATFMRPFDLRGKLWTSDLLRVSDTHRYWQFCCHHLIADGWSLKLLVNELVATYNQLKKNDNAGEVAPAYLDYIAEDLIYLDSRHYQSDLKFWLDRYKTLPPALIPVSSQNQELTNELPPPHLWQLKNEYFHKIENIAAEHGLSVLHFMYAILACYFSRTTETEDIVIGIPIHNRRNAKQKNTIGMFSSVIPISVSIKKEDSFLDIMRNVAAELRRCYKHQRLPITEINQNTRIRQKTGRAQLFDITLSLEWFEFNVHMEGTETTFQTPHRATQFPLAISIYQYNFEDKNNPVTVEFNFDTRYLSREDVMDIQSRLALLVDAAITSLDMTVEHAPILPPTERQQVVVDFNATDADFPQHTLIHERFEQQVELTPATTAVVFEEQSLSYAELNRRANQLAHRLLTLGIKPDDRVALCVERGLEMVVGLMGILKSGAAYVPLDPTYPAERLAYMIDDAKPVALLTQSDKVIQTEDIPVIMLDTDSFDTYATSNPNAKALGVTSTHLAYVIYTSGSTGKPKGVMVTHRNVLNLASGLKTLLAFEHSNRIALNASIVFDASVQNWIQILSGHTLVIVPDAIRTDARQLWRYFSHHAVDLFDCTPVQLQWLLDADLGTDPDYQPAQVLIGGDAITSTNWSRLQQISDTRFINVYGPTECTVDATACLIDASQPTPTIGRPLTNTKVYILDTQGQPVPIGVTGEIYIGGAGVARGYLNRPDLTAERFITNPFVDEQEARLYKTGDLGRWRHDGSIAYLGRNDFQVKLRGFRLELGEIETLLMQCPGIEEAVVIVRKDIPGDTRLVAYFQAQPDTQPTPADLRLQLSQRLAEYMIPSAFVALDTFPLTPNGKLDRKALPEPDQSAMVTRHYEAPQGEMETMLASIWQTLLGIDHVSRYDHFFELGGQSLMVVSLIEQLRNQGKTLDVRSAFSAPVLYEMARAIQNHQDDTALVIPPNLIRQDCTTITPDQLPLIALSQFEIDSITSTVPGGVTNVQDIYPLAPLQEGIFFHRLYQQTGDIYQLDIVVAFDTRERLDVFLNTLQKVIDRHDILRTAICWQGLSQPVQVVWRHAPLPVNTFEPESSENIAAQLQTYISPQMHSLDLNQAPLLAADIVYDPSRSEWLMALRVHHLVSDHMTLDLIIEEVRLILWGKTDELSPPQPYRNFIAHVLSIPNAVHEQYFRSRLADVDTPTIPFGLTQVQDYDGEMAEATLSLDHNLVDAIHHHARQLSVSPGVLFHVAWAQVLAQISDSSDVIFGSVLLGRLQGFTGADRVMGMFVNTLPLRIPLNNRSVLDIINSTNNELLSLLEHEQAPLALAQRCSSVAPPIPLFSTLLNYRRTQANTAATTWEGMTLLAESRRTTYPFNFSVDDQGDSIEILSQTIADVDPARIARYLETALRGLVDALESDPQRPILSVSILPEEERQRLLVDFNATDVELPQTLIHQLFEQQVAQTPDATAVVFEAQWLSYAELNRRANRLAHHLLSLGVKPDDRIALCLERSPDMVIGLLGILKAGAAYVPMDPAYPAERLAYMLDDAAPVVLLTHSSLRDAFRHSLPVVMLDNAALFDACPETNPRVQGLNVNHLAYIIYTSGSTGKPKGVMVEHRGLSNYLLWARGYYATAGTLDSIVSSPVAFDATVTSLYLPLLCGGSMRLIHDGQELTELLPALLDAQPGTLVKITPTHLAALGQELQSARKTCPELLFVVGGEALSPATVALWQALSSGSRIINEYGPTETVVGCITFDARTPNSLTDSVPIGRPIANTRIYILDAKGQPAPVGVAGELYIGGAGVARGYLHRPDLTAERFIADPFSGSTDARLYKTGDLGRWLPDGNIEYLGRNDFQIKVRGFRIEPGEIEARLLQCHGVQEALVIAREDNPGDTRLVAYLTAQPGAGIVPSVLRKELALHLAEYMIPSAFVALDTFPLTPNGKLDRKVLPMPEQSAIASRGYEAPVGELEMALTEIWQNLLGLDRIGRHDHFFELGGHSILAVQCVTRVRQMLGLDLQVQKIFANPVLSELAQELTNTSTIAVTAIPLADRSQPLPLSFSQQRLWFLIQLEPTASRAYNLPAALRLIGRFDKKAFITALDGLVARHESLRTRFISFNGQPCQKIDPATIGFNLSCLDLRALDDATRAQRVSELAAQESRAPFNLTEGPLIRGQLLQLDDDTHVMLLTMHHIISDGWSIGILASELAALYQAALDGSDANLPPLPVQYADYTVWQRQWLQGETLNDLRDFWRNQLQGAPALLEIPTDRPRPSVQRYEGNILPVSLDPEELAALRTLCRQQGTTLFMTLLAVWSVVLSRLSGQGDIVVGTPLANRKHSETEGLIGFFVNTLALRITPSQCQTVGDLFTQIRERAIAAYTYQDLPFEQVVETLQPARSLSYSPIFQVMLSLNNTPMQALTLPGLELSAIERPQRSTHFDLTLSLTETERSLEGGLIYSTDLFDHETIVRLRGYLRNVLMAMTDDVTQPVATLPMLPEAERRQVIVDFNATDADFPQDALIHQLVEDQAARTPEAIAVLFEDQHLTYDALNRRANQLAHHLLSLGVKPDDRVAICVERSLDMVIGLLGILKAGAAYVPLDPGYPAERLAYMLDDAAPVALLTQAGRHELQTGELPLILLDTADFSTRSDHNPDIAGLDAHHLAYVIYTSGSTGKPKGVMNSHRGLCNRLVWMQNTYRLTPDDRVLQKTPFSFDVSVWEFFWPLLYGARLVMARPDGHKDAAYLAQLIERTGITTLHFVPSMLQQFVQWADADCACDSLRRVICSGEALPAELQQRFFARFNAQLHNLYGPTEAAIDVTFWACQPDDHRSFVPIGRPIANTQLYILDALGQPVPLGVAGELHIG